MLSEHLTAILSVVVAIVAILQARSLWLQGQARHDRDENRKEVVDWLRRLEHRVGKQNGRVGKLEEWSRIHEPRINGTERRAAHRFVASDADDDSDKGT